MLRLIYIGVLVFLATQLFAQNHSLNGKWSFQTDRYNKGLKEGWQHPEYQPLGWDEMDVPGNWDLENEYADYAGVGWYRKTFTAESAWQGKRVRLHFESVYNDAVVWLNGKKIAENHLGFLPFWVDVQDLLQEENVLVVRVDNAFKRGAIWNWGGIRRSVWLEVTPMARLEYQHITAVPDLKKGTAQIAVKMMASNATSSTASLGYQLSIADPDGNIVYRSEQLKGWQLPAHKETAWNLAFQLKKKDVQLWHFNRPKLYTATLSLLQDGQTVHQITDRFGIRKVEIDGMDFKLNGEAVRTVGFNYVSEDRATGNTLPLWRIKADVDMMKQLGANMARLSHLPLPKAFLDYLDEKGIMTFEKVSLWGKDEMANPNHPTPKVWLERMVRSKYNHPSIIGWSIGNEIGYMRDNPEVMAYVEGATQHAKRLDSTRIITNVSHSAQDQPSDPVDFSDMILYNRYGNWGKDADKVHQLHPGKPIFMAEFGHQLNSEDPAQASINAKEMLGQLRHKTYVMGASLWTFNDYRSFWKSVPTWTTPPSQNRTWGVVTSLREKKQPYLTFRKEYAPVKALEFQASEGDKKGKVTLVPRTKLDIPAYPMRGYRLLWASVDAEGKVINGSFKALPEILPGSAALDIPVQWALGNAAGLEIHLLDPQDYSVLDTTLHFQVPQAPSIIAVHTSDKKARVVFNPSPNAESYLLRYRTKGEAWQESTPTVNGFVEVEKLAPLQAYEFTVVAKNGKGMSQPSKAVIASTDEDELPPHHLENRA